MPRGRESEPEIKIIGEEPEPEIKVIEEKTESEPTVEAITTPFCGGRK